MNVTLFKNRLHPKVYDSIIKYYKTLRPAQVKAVNAGLLNGKNLLVCTPTASGKTLIAEIAMAQCVYNKSEKAVYITPLKALATEKYDYFKKRYEKVALSIGELDSSETRLKKFDFIITTSEKMGSLLRHSSPFIHNIGVIVIDEIHLLNDYTRGPTLEFIITMLRKIKKNAQIIGLSATIGNPNELAEWLDAKLVLDDSRPVKLKKGIYFDGEIKFFVM